MILPLGQLSQQPWGVGVEVVAAEKKAQTEQSGREYWGERGFMGRDGLVAWLVSQSVRRLSRSRCTAHCVDSKNV